MIGLDAQCECAMYAQSASGRFVRLACSLLGENEECGRNQSSSIGMSGDVHRDCQTLEQSDVFRCRSFRST